LTSLRLITYGDVAVHDELLYGFIEQGEWNMFKKTLLAAFAALFLSFGTAFAAEKININQADAIELQTLNGVGPAIAEAIVTYREQNGAFASVEELSAVKGIGDKKVEKLADLVTVTE
jgi:competence protein ComEA